MSGLKLYELNFMIVQGPDTLGKKKKKKGNINYSTLRKEARVPWVYLKNSKNFSLHVIYRTAVILTFALQSLL